MKKAIRAGADDLLKGVFLVFPLLFLTNPFNTDFNASEEFGNYSFWQMVRRRYNKYLLACLYKYLWNYTQSAILCRIQIIYFCM